MGCSRKLRKFISFFDVYSSPFQIQFNYNTLFQTTFGGVVSLVLYIILLAAVIFLYVLLHKKDEQQIITFDARYDSPPKYTIDFNKDNIVYSKNDTKNAFFIPAFYLIDKFTGEFVEPSEYLEIKIEDTIKKGKDEETLEISHSKCSDKYSGLNSFLNNLVFEKAQCLDIDSLEIEGDFLSETFRYTSIKFNYKVKNSNIEQYQLVFLYTEYSINNQIHGKSPISFSAKPIEIDLVMNFQLSYDVYISLDEFNSQDNLYAHWSKKNSQKVGRVNKILKHVAEMNIKKRLATITLRSESEYKRYERTYTTFFQMISRIGGLWKVLMFIGGLIVIGINSSIMNVSISNLMFNMINPVNKNQVDLPYKDYLKKEEKYNTCAPIFLSLNPILKELAFKYYKYERNRGMPFTIKEALSKVFCFCCKVPEIEQKHRIFAKSGGEIQKYLDTTRIARVTHQIKAIEKILLGDDAVMLKYLKKRNVEYDNLYLINKDLIHQKITNSATPMALTYYKQGFFTNALIAMRNQGNLTNTDFLLLKLLKLEPDLVKKYFISIEEKFKDY